MIITTHKIRNVKYVFDDLVVDVMIMIYLNFWHDIYVFAFFFCKDGTAQQGGGNGGVNGGGQGK